MPAITSSRKRMRGLSGWSSIRSTGSEVSSAVMGNSATSLLSLPSVLAYVTGSPFFASGPRYFLLAAFFYVFQELFVLLDF